MSAPMMPEAPDCGVPCGLCESLAHLYAKSREEASKYKSAFEFELNQIQKLQEEIERLQKKS